MNVFELFNIKMVAYGWIQANESRNIPSVTGSHDS